MKYARWTLVENEGRWWKCRCDCGNVKWVEGRNVRAGKSKSCGCYQKEMSWVVRPTARSKTETRTWHCWRDMIRRCHQKHRRDYADYGAKGIRVSKEWRASFQTFVSDMGLKPDGLTLDRIDNTKGYNKENCRWATRAQQYNNRGDNVYVVWKGRRYTMMQVAQLTRKPYGRLMSRFRRGYTIEQAVSLPLHKRGRKTIVR